MSNVTEHVDVDVPVSTAYNQWTQFEEFPRFMDGIERVQQLDDRRMHWVANFGGSTHEWDAEITEQIPDERVAWKSTSGQPNAGVITFHRIDDNTCRLMLQIDHEPDGVVDHVGDWLGFVKRRAKGDLERFKELIEGRGSGNETGAWRGEVGQSATS